MGRGRLSGSRAGAVTASLQSQQPTAPAQKAPAAPARAPKPQSQASGPPDASKGFSALSGADQTAMLQRQRQLMTGSSRQAIREYTDPSKEPGTGYAKSQNMNHALNTGAKLTAAQAKTQQELDRIMVPIGKQTVLYRADHDGFLTRMGINSQSYATSAELNRALKGRTWTQKGFLSTSHTRSMSPFMPGNYMGGGREVEIEYHTSPRLKAALIQHSQAEVLLSRDTHHRIVEARYTGGTAYPQKGGRKRVLKLTIEVW